MPTTQAEPVGRMRAASRADDNSAQEVLEKISPKALEKYQSILDKDVDQQAEFFLKSFIFALGDEWTKVNKLVKEWKLELKSRKLARLTLDEAEFMSFNQHIGRPHTAQLTRLEFREIDVRRDGQHHFLQACMLYFKVMVLKEYYREKDMKPEENLDADDADTALNVGHKLIESTMTMPGGLSPELEEAIEKFQGEKKARERKMKELEDKAEAGGVKGLAARNELEQMVASDATELNRMEVSLAAAKRLAVKKGGEAQLQKMRAKAEAEEAEKKQQGKAKMDALASKFGGSVNIKAAGSK